MIFRQKRPAPGSVPALFLHIQKTGGTAIVNRARQFYGDSITSHGQCWGLAPEQLRSIKFISGHIGYQFAQLLLDRRFSFTFLRDPAERILSMYYFCRARDPAEFMIYRRAHELDLADFLLAGLSDPWVKKNIWNNQVWQLAHGYAHLDQRTIGDFDVSELLDLARQHLGMLSYVGFTETLQADTQAILAHLEIPADSRIEVVNPTQGRPRLDDLSARDKALLGELTMLDRQLYEFARQRFANAPTSVSAQR